MPEKSVCLEKEQRERERERETPPSVQFKRAVLTTLATEFLNLEALAEKALVGF